MMMATTMQRQEGALLSLLLLTFVVIVTVVVAAEDSSATTSYIDVHEVSSFSPNGGVESGYLFRVPLSTSTFSSLPPMAPRWSSNSALTADDGARSSEDSDTTYPAHRLLLPPESDMYLCSESIGLVDYSDPSGNTNIFDPDTMLSGYEQSYILIPRGHCSFESKTRSAQRLGASGVVIRNTLDSYYTLIDEDNVNVITDNEGHALPSWSNTQWPIEKYDYECGTNTAINGIGWRANVDPTLLLFDPPPYGEFGRNNKLLTGPAVDGNLCAMSGDAAAVPATTSFDSQCPSKRCVLTGRNSTMKVETSENTNDEHYYMEACCAWDVLLRMSSDGDNDGDFIPMYNEEEITIASLFVTMEKGEELYDLIVNADDYNAASDGSVRYINIVPYTRWYPLVPYYSMILLWVLAVFTLWVSTYESAKEYRHSWKKISQAINDGILVWQRIDGAPNEPAGGGGNNRPRAGTDDTIDSYDEVMELQFAPGEVEMTTTTTSTTPPTANVFNVHGNNNDTSSRSIISTDVSTTTPSTRHLADTTSPGLETRDENFVIEDINDDSPTETANKVTFDHENNAANDNSTPSNGEFAPVGSFRPETEEAISTAPQQQPQQQAESDTHSNPAAAAKPQGMSVFLIIAFAAISIFCIFVFGVDKVLRILYVIVGSIAVKKNAIVPLYEMVATKFLSDASKKLHSSSFRGMKWIDVLSAVPCGILGITWMALGLFLVQPNNVFYWVYQDIMGVCLCILILEQIRFNNISLPTVILLLLFFYHMSFFVIMPLIFGTSSVLNVASSTVDTVYCEKYPSDSICWGALAPFPFALLIPRFNDYRGGYALPLALGDILFPGLLISFLARYDSAKRLVSKCYQIRILGEEVVSEERSASQSRNILKRLRKALFSRYFGPLCIAYSIGLLGCYVSVSVTKISQPTLIYIVPSCIGTLFFLGLWRRALSELWTGPQVMVKADRMIELAGKIPQARVAASMEASNNLAETSSVI